MEKTFKGHVSGRPIKSTDLMPQQESEGIQRLDPWISLYIAAASVACSVAMMVDYVQGFRHSKVCCLVDCVGMWVSMGGPGMQWTFSDKLLWFSAYHNRILLQSETCLPASSENVQS
ncbi:hypothetical protein ACLOJK_008064 [Asimina triloba]